MNITPLNNGGGSDTIDNAERQLHTAYKPNNKGAVTTLPIYLSLPPYLVPRCNSTARMYDFSASTLSLGSISSSSSNGTGLGHKTNLQKVVVEIEI